MKSLLAAVCFLGLATLSSAAYSQTPQSRQSIQAGIPSDVQVTSVQLKKGGMDFTKSSQTSKSRPTIKEVTGGGDYSMTGRQRCFQIWGACGTWNIWVSGGTGQQAYEHALLYYDIVICY